MMSKRKFYRTVFLLEVLSEDPVGEPGLKALDYMITEGDCSGQLKLIRQEEMNGKQAAEALHVQASDPGFFQLTDDGKDTYE